MKVTKENLQKLYFIRKFGQINHMPLLLFDKNAWFPAKSEYTELR